MWPFKKNTHEKSHPLVEEFRTLTDDPRCLEWFEKVVHGWDQGLPIDIGFKVQEAINLSYTITSLAGVHSSDLLKAAKSRNFRKISDRLHVGSRNVNGYAADNSRSLARIIEWANDYNLPSLQKWDATFYKQAGIPRDIKSLSSLRFLLVMDDHGVKEIPAELSQLPLLQGLCISNNKITAIPTELYRCPSLQRLDLEDNLISRVEDGIDGLSNVYAIDLSGNKLTYVTPDIARMPSLAKLDIRKQRTTIDMMRAIDTPLSDDSLSALYKLDQKIDVKY